MNKEEKQNAFDQAALTSPFWNPIRASRDVELPGCCCLGELGCELGRVVIHNRQGEWGLFSLIDKNKKVRFVPPEEDEIRKVCVVSGDCGPCPFNPERQNNSV